MAFAQKTSARGGAAALVACCIVATATAAAATARIDLTATAAATTKFPHFWEASVGSSHAAMGLRVDWREHLTMAVRDCGFKGIRMHAIFDDDMSVVFPPCNFPPCADHGGHGIPAPAVYSWYNVDKLYDFLLSINVQPLVELSFMPQALAGCRQGCPTAHSIAVNMTACIYGQHYMEIRMPPGHAALGTHNGHGGGTPKFNGPVVLDFGIWHDLIAAFAHHLIERYGEAEVLQWPFEVWNEMWGVTYPDPYMGLFNASAVALRGVNPKLRVGGPATMQTQHLQDFVNRATALGVRPDFVSAHLYPSDANCSGSSSAGFPHASEIDCFASVVKDAAVMVAPLPFYLTEYNVGLSTSSGLDLNRAAAFITRNAFLLAGTLDVFSYWCFSDIFEEMGLIPTPFHSGYGLITVNGIPKPAYRAFELLHRAGDMRVPVNVTKTTAAGGSLVVAATVNASSGGEEPAAASFSWRSLQIFASFYSKEAGQVDSPLSQGASNLEVRIEIAHDASISLPATAIGHRIDANHTAPINAWVKEGSPDYPTAAQQEAMMNASQLATESIVVAKVAPGLSAIVFTMQPDSVFHLQF
tara:strand:+ start:70 stop:1821 length:1752 start_codon:yes stop_codon:yes gene_type:complete